MECVLKCEKLDVWKKSATLLSSVYIELRDLRDYGFKDKLTRSSLSVSSNIAEGIERILEKEKVRFLDISKGSIAEAKTQIYIGMKIEYLRKDIGEHWIKEFGEIGKMVSGLIRSINTGVENGTTNN